MNIFHSMLLPEMRDEVRSHLDAASLAMLRMTCRQEQKEGCVFLGKRKRPEKLLAKVCIEQGYANLLLWVFQTYSTTRVVSERYWYQDRDWVEWESSPAVAVNVALPCDSDDDI